MRIPAATLAVLLVLSPRVLAAEELGPHALVLETGAFDALRGTSVQQQAGLALRVPLRWGFEGEVGVTFADGSVAFAHVGLGRDVPVLGPFVARPSLGVVAYHSGAAKELGSVLEFKSALEVAVLMRDGWRLGVAFYHLSNAAIATHNPGEESLVVTCAIPYREVRALFARR